MIFPKTIPAVFSFLVIFLASCAGTGWGTGYSQYGFYSSPEETISDFSTRGSLSSAEHFILAHAYKDSGDLKKAAVHFANSAFVRDRNLTLKPFPGTILV